MRSTNWLAIKVFDLSSGEYRGKIPTKPFVVSVPKRVIPLAVHRNRIRRLIREVIRQSGMVSKPGSLLFLSVVRKPGNLKLTDVKTAIEALL